MEVSNCNLDWPFDLDVDFDMSFSLLNISAVIEESNLDQLSTIQEIGFFTWTNGQNYSNSFALIFCVYIIIFVKVTNSSRPNFTSDRHVLRARSKAKEQTSVMTSPFSDSHQKYYQTKVRNKKNGQSHKTQLFISFRTSLITWLSNIRFGLGSALKSYPDKKMDLKLWLIINRFINFLSYEFSSLFLIFIK